MRPTIALVTAGVEMDALGIAYHDFTGQPRDHVCEHHPRGDHFKESIIHAFAHGTRSLRDDGLRLLASGLTSAEELLRVTRE